MMGSVCFMVHGHMCCGVTNSALLVRVGQDAYRKMVDHPNVRPFEIGGRRPKGFVLVDPAGYCAEGDLAAWINRGVRFVSTLPPKKPTAQKRNSKAASKRPRVPSKLQ